MRSLVFTINDDGYSIVVDDQDGIRHEEQWELITDPSFINGNCFKKVGNGSGIGETSIREEGMLIDFISEMTWVAGDIALYFRTHPAGSGEVAE